AAAEPSRRPAFRRQPPHDLHRSADLGAGGIVPHRPRAARAPAQPPLSELAARERLGFAQSPARVSSGGRRLVLCDLLELLRERPDRSVAEAGALPPRLARRHPAARPLPRRKVALALALDARLADGEEV